MNTYVEYLDNTIQELQKQQKELIHSERKDEANFIRVKMNICDIAKTIYSVLAKKNSGITLREEYVRQLSRLRENWNSSYQKAKEYGDVQNTLVEETKLEMLQKVIDRFDDLGENE